MNISNEIELLDQHLAHITYPEGFAAKIPHRLKRKAFYPGGKGTYDNSDTISDKQFMFLGQDFDCVDGFEVTASIQHDQTATWRAIEYLLEKIQINPNDCFFTNAFMGLRWGNKATGKSPAFKNVDFVRQNQAFFLRQIEIQKPKVIFALGIHVANFLSDTSDDLTNWKKLKNFQSFDATNNALKKGVRFNNGIVSNVLLLLHPSFRNPNLRFRSYRELDGHDAELALINEAIHQS